MKGVMLFYKSLQLTILKSWNDNWAQVCVTTVSFRETFAHLLSARGVGRKRSHYFDKRATLSLYNKMLSQDFFIVSVSSLFYYSFYFPWAENRNIMRICAAEHKVYFKWIYFFQAVVFCLCWILLLEHTSIIQFLSFKF